MGCSMTEQRRNIRIPVKMNLEVSDIFKQDNVKVSNINAPIEVIDICRDGIGFVTKSVLPIGLSIFNSFTAASFRSMCRSVSPSGNLPFSNCRP